MISTSYLWLSISDFRLTLAILLPGFGYLVLSVFLKHLSTHKAYIIHY